MNVVLTALAILPLAFGEHAALSEIPFLLGESTLDTSGGGVSLLQRAQGHVHARRGEDSSKAKKVVSPQTLTAGHDLDESKNATQSKTAVHDLNENSNATEVKATVHDSDENKNATEPKTVVHDLDEVMHATEASLPQLEEQALPQVSSNRANSSSSLIGSMVGVSEGMGLDYSAQALPQVVVTRSVRSASAIAEGREESKPPTKNNNVLMVIEMFPLCWLFAVDRFYLGNIGLGIAKLAVSLGTFFVGGAIWGLVDFIIIMNNALRQQQTLHSAGLSANFPESQLQTAFVLAIVDILMIPVFIWLARFLWLWRRQQRMERLKEAAMRSPHYGMEPHQVKGG